MEGSYCTPQAPSEAVTGTARAEQGGSATAKSAGFTEFL